MQRLLVVFVLFLISCGENETSGVIQGARCQLDTVIDGDSLYAICNREKLEIRLYCIDAPEYQQQPWGEKSFKALQQLLPPQSIFEVRVIEEDQYHRLVGIVKRRGVSINLQMVKQGQAAVYRRYCTEAPYFKAEEKAKRHKLGIWSKPGKHQKPWRWRSS